MKRQMKNKMKRQKKVEEEDEEEEAEEVNLPEGRGSYTRSRGLFWLGVNYERQSEVSSGR